MHAMLVVLGFLSSLGLLVLATRLRRSALAPRSWPTVSAIVRCAEVVLHPAGPGPERSTYAARVLYDYTVEGKLYHGDCIAAGMQDSDRRGYPDSLVLRYATGNVAFIHHHPTEPARSVLEIHPRGAGLLPAAAGVALMAASAVALLMLAF